MLYRTKPWPVQSNVQLSVLRRGLLRTGLPQESHTPRRDMNPLLRLGHRPRDFASEKLTGLHCDSVSPNSMLENKIWIKCWRPVRKQRSPRIGIIGPLMLTSKCDGDMSSCPEFSSRVSEFGWLMALFLLTSSLAGSRVRLPAECMPNTGKPAEEKRRRKRSMTPARGWTPKRMTLPASQTRKAARKAAPPEHVGETSVEPSSGSSEGSLSSACGR